MSHTGCSDRLAAPDEDESEAHKLFRSFPGHERKGEAPKTDNEEHAQLPGVESPGSTGVLYCSERGECIQRGFHVSHADEQSGSYCQRMEF